MKTTEIADAVQVMVERGFDADTFAFDFLQSFGLDDTSLARLRKVGRGSQNKSDIEGGVLPGGKARMKVHTLPAAPGEVDAAMAALQNSKATTKQKARFLLATDGESVQAIDRDGADNDVLACAWNELTDRFGFFFPMVGISTTKEIRDNPIDIKATGRLDKLYVELLKDPRNSDWAEEDGRGRFNHFMAQLIFCFYAEDTSIFYHPGIELDARPDNWAGYFTETLRERTKSDGTDMKTVMEVIFGTMALDTRDGTRSRANDGAGLPLWTDRFPYVNGGLFSETPNVPHFSRMARTYLIRAGELRWTDINPDIFGSMIQAVADDKERGSLGMHYTSVPNILKVLNPLFLDDLREQLDRAGSNPQQLGKFKKRLEGIRVFDPACGSGNFLVIAYKRLRELEDAANRAGGWGPQRSRISLKNFRGIEIKSFAAEVARLALIIAEYQCDAIHLDQKQADALFLPLDKENWIVCGNALRLDWLDVCPPPGETKVKLTSDDLFDTPLDQSEIDFENEGGEVFICGNPPYLGSKLLTEAQKEDLKIAAETLVSKWKTLDFIGGWFLKTAKYVSFSGARAGLVSTNSISQGQQVDVLWTAIQSLDVEISFARTSFQWNNPAPNQAVVTVVVIGLRRKSLRSGALLYDDNSNAQIKREVDSIGPYLIPNSDVIVRAQRDTPADRPSMLFGNMPRDGGGLLLESLSEAQSVDAVGRAFLKRYVGSAELIRGKVRYCFWIADDKVDEAMSSRTIANALASVSDTRLQSAAKSTREFANTPHRFVQIAGVAKRSSIIIPRVSSEAREYLPIGIADANTIVSDSAFAIYDAPLWAFSILSSKLHLTWIAAVCGKMKTDFRYSNTIGWNTFPLPKLTQLDKDVLTRNAKRILLARQEYFPSTIAEMYDPSRMDRDYPILRTAHETNDNDIEEIYIGKTFANSSERLQTLLSMYMEEN